MTALGLGNGKHREAKGRITIEVRRGSGKRV